MQALKDQVAYAELDVAGWRAQGVSGVAAMRAKGILPVPEGAGQFIRVHILHCKSASLVTRLAL